MYIYEDHMGGLYTSDRELSHEEIYCEQCGDWDWLLGYAETKEKAWNLLKESVDINGSGGWNYDYVIWFLNANWNDDFTPVTHEYTELNCPECGATLYVYYDGPNKHNDVWIVRHCDNCLCDWESELGEDGVESTLVKKFWG